MYWLFLSVSLYAVNNVLWKIFVKNENPLRLISRRAVFTVAIAFAALWITKVDVISFIQNPKAVLVLAGSLFGVGGLVMMVTFLKSGSLVRMGYYSLLGTFIAAAYTYAFGEAPVLFKTILGALLIIAGYLVFLLNEKHQAEHEPVIFSQHLLLAGMTTSFSISLLIMWECLKIFPPLTVIASQEVIVLTVTALASFLLRKRVINNTPHRITTRNTIIMALVIFAAILTGTLGLKTADPFLASVTGIAAPVLTVAAGSIVFREKLNPKHVFALVLMILGGLALAWPG